MPARLYLIIALALTGCAAETTITVKDKLYSVDYRREEPVPLEDVEKKLSDDPKNPRAYFLKGLRLERKGQLRQAITLYLSGMERFKNLELPKDAKFTGGHFRIGLCYVRLRAYQQAIYHLAQVAAMEPEDNLAACINNPHFREARYLLGACYHELLDNARARRHLDRFVELGGESWRVAPLLYAGKRREDQND